MLTGTTTDNRAAYYNERVARWMTADNQVVDPGQLLAVRDGGPLEIGHNRFLDAYGTVVQNLNGEYAGGEPFYGAVNQQPDTGQRHPAADLHAEDYVNAFAYDVVRRFPR